MRSAFQPRPFPKFWHLRESRRVGFGLGKDGKYQGDTGGGDDRPGNGYTCIRIDNL